MIEITDVTKNTVMVKTIVDDNCVILNLVDDDVTNDMLKQLNNNPNELDILYKGKQIKITDRYILTDLRVLLVSFFFMIDYDKKML
jgi:hypothetical protein